MTVKRGLLLALGACLLSCAAFVMGFLLPHPVARIGLSGALDVHHFLGRANPLLAVAAGVALLAEAGLAWRGRRPRFRWTLFAGGLALVGYSTRFGLATSFKGV